MGSIAWYADLINLTLVRIQPCVAFNFLGSLYILLSNLTQLYILSNSKSIMVKCGHVKRVREVGIFYVCELDKGHEGNHKETVFW